MRDSLNETDSATPLADTMARAEALFSLGSFYVRQGFPKQGLSLLLASRNAGLRSLELNRAIAHGFLLSGAPKSALSQLDALEVELDSEELREAARVLRARALLALGRVDEAQRLFQKRIEPPPRRGALSRRDTGRAP